MRVSLRLIAVALLCVLVGSAKAVRINLLDPTGVPTPITTQDFTVAFSTCARGELPPSSPSQDGCFAGTNNTGQSWTGIQLVVPATPLVAAQGVPTCNTDDPSDQIFGMSSCVYNAQLNAYVLNFFGGTIPYSTGPTTPVFLITEDGLPPEDFPLVSASVTFATTPEPSAVTLLGTGLLCTGMLVYSRRRTRA